MCNNLLDYLEWQVVYTLHANMLNSK